MQKPYLEAGEFVTTHGVIGELKLYPWSDNPLFLKGFAKLYLSKNKENTNFAAHKITAVRAHKNMCLVKLEGIESLEAARAFIGKTAYIARAEAKLPNGRYFVQDLIGVSVQNFYTGEVYGTIADVSRPGRHDIYDIHSNDGKHWLFPAAEPFVESIDIENRLIKIKPIEGMFDD